MNQTNHPQNIGQLGQGNAGLIIKLLLLFIFVGGISAFLSWLIFSNEFNFQAASGLDEVVVAEIAPIPLEQPGLVALSVDEANVSIGRSFDPPDLLDLGGYQLAVSNRYLDQAALWDSVELDHSQVAWLENSIIHYVFRVPPNRGYKDVLTDLAGNGDRITLLTGSGRELHYSLNHVSTQLVSNRAIPQSRPAITLVWIGEDGEQLSVSGRFVPSKADVDTIEYRPNAPSAAAGPSDITSVRIDAIEAVANGLVQVRGVITNQGADAQLISAQDITLQSGQFASKVVTAEPPLPWQVPPNNSQMAFVVDIQSPRSNVAQLMIGEQRYQITVNHVGTD